MSPVPPILWIVVLAHRALAINVCPRPPEIPFATTDTDKAEYDPGEEITYHCNAGYVRQSGSRRYTCPSNGRWPVITLTCTPRKCPFPGTLSNGDLLLTDLNYQSVIRFSCNTGYILQGPTTSQCLADGQWSAKLPQCQPVICPPPPVSEFGALSYRRNNPGNTFFFQDVITFECLSPYALFGRETASCLSDGIWSELPECRSVQCPYPEATENGFINFALRRIYNYGETVTYGCNPSYVLEGAAVARCEKSGHWSPKPTCRAPCKIPAKRGTVLYNGEKVKVKNLPNGIQHAEIIWFFCKNSEQDCSYKVSTQCLDGHLSAPACFKEPGLFSFWKTEAADMTPCGNPN